MMDDIMKLFVLRHGQAEPTAASDADRALTQRGREDVANVIGKLQGELTGLDQLWVSPYRRAQQTAQTVIETLAWRAAPVTTDLLVPEGQTARLYDELQRCDARSLLLVSHQPLVGHLVADLCGAEPGRYPMGTASLAYLEIELAASGLGRLQWLRHREDAG